MGTRLVVGVVTDDGAERYKGKRPQQDQWTRMQIIAALRYVDEVMMQDGTDPTSCLETLRPQIMTHGDDWSELREGAETLRRLGIEWRLIPCIDHPHTSETLARIRGG